MCVSDWRLGRLITFQQTLWDDGSSKGQTYLPNMQRVGILFGSVDGDLTLPAYSKIQIDGVDHTEVGTGHPDVFYTLEKHGLLVTRKFTISPIATGSKGSVIEFFLPEAYIAACIKSFDNEYAQYLQQAQPGQPGYIPTNY